MSKLTKIMLALLVISSVATALFLTGIINVSAVPGLYVAFPLAAVLYGAFLICLALDKEVAAFDAEEHAHHDHIAPEIHPHNVESLHGHDHHESLAA
jgi:hypothetical protein